MKNYLRLSQMGISDFFWEKSLKVFILKGYSGTEIDNPFLLKNTSVSLTAFLYCCGVRLF